MLSIALCAMIASAQGSPRRVTSHTLDATRAELTHRLDSLQRVDSTAGKPADRRARRDEIAALRTRLAEGDFQAGDRFILDYGDPSKPRDTVVVRDSQNIALLNWPSTSLRGVLRAELQPAVERYVGTYVRVPRVRTYPLTRLSFVGGVGRPGVYAVDPARSLSDAIMDAGGTGQIGKAEKISVYRGNSRVMNEKQVAEAIRDGATLNELGLQSGDQVRVALQKQGGSKINVQTVFLTVSVLTALLALIRASYTP